MTACAIQQELHVEMQEAQSEEGRLHRDESAVALNGVSFKLHHVSHSSSNARTASPSSDVAAAAGGGGVDVWQAAIYVSGCVAVPMLLFSVSPFVLPHHTP
jgi:hypothetical protein